MARIALVLALVSALFASSAAAQDAPRPIRSAFDRPFALGAYASAWAGAYDAIGGGGRLRWEPFDLLGFEVFGEAHAVAWPGAIRHDHQLGFNMYVPIELTEWLRLRPLFGFCVILSMIEPGESSTPRADDVLFGVHGGVGIEASIDTWASVFFDVQAAAYMGHDRSNGMWSGGVGGDYVPIGNVQGVLGVAVHFGD
jgi:hypothetical protein